MLAASSSKMNLLLSAGREASSMNAKTIALAARARGIFTNQIQQTQ
jgi:hypothetical protein